MKFCILLFISLLVWNELSAQILHDNTCSSISANFTLDWDETPTVNQFNWTPQGSTTFTASNIQGTGYQIGFEVTGATGSLTSDAGINTPGVTSSARSGNVDGLHISTDGLTSNEEIKLTMTFTPALAGNISFDLYNVRRQFINGADPGQQIEVYGLTSTGYAIVPQLAENGSPSWELEGPGVIDGNASSTAGTNDQVGVNFKSISDITTITVILRRCSGCGNVGNTEFALGDIDICLTPDTDQDGIADTQDEDDDNDGILDVIEKCPTSAPVTAEWDNMPYLNGDPSNTYSLPDGTNMAVTVSSNGASIVAGETNSDLTGGNGGGTVGLFLNGNQNLQVNSIDASFKWDQAISDLEFSIFDVDQLGGQYVDSITIMGFYDGFVVFPTMTASANNTITQNRAVGDNSTDDNLASANVDVSFGEPIDSMVIFYGNGSTAPPAPGNQWITIWDFTYIGDCGSVDSDGDGVADYLDIDADNDGIIDNIERQGSTINPIIPAGNDGNNNGVDDNFEGAPTPVDTDGDGIPDFQDPDSDNDGDLDLLEGWDTNNDGTANTLPQGTDPDGDGLDGLADGSGFDDQNGWNSTTNITNNGQNSEDFPNLDNNLTAELDWREDNDFDGDGIQNYDDIDDDNDGILDVNEGRGNNNPNGDEDGDGIQNWSDVTDNGNGGDGSVTDYTDSDGNGLPDVYDVDNDGQPNHMDLDSDGDGVADIIEAGGLDSNGDGIVDDAFDDGSVIDGWSDVFDIADGGMPLTDIDVDGDGIQSHLDIDADGDGIVDIIESQASGALISPSGIDTDSDGIDDNFDTDNGNVLTDPENTDSVDNPDYLDTNSDNDVDSDLIEGWDTDNDGIADTSPSGSDSDNDGLDDNFEDYNMLTLQNYALNVTDNGETSATFPDIDVPGGERDWRDVNNTNDNDGDGILNVDDIDDDNDGVLDVDEGCAELAEVEGGFSSSSGGVTDANEAAGAPDGQYAQIYTNGQFVILDFGQVYAAGTQYRITWRLRNNITGTAEMDLYESTGASGPWTEHPTALPTNSDPNNFTAELITSDISFQYLRFGKGNHSTTDYEIDAVEVLAVASEDVTPSIAGGIGAYTITSDGQLEITMTGGDGGGSGNGSNANPGGSGASITAVFDVLDGDVVRFVVGEGSNTATTSAGGGGSTGLFINNDLVMVAGGGGGGDNSGDGLGASATTTGVSGTGGGAGSGGVGGNGGGSNGGASGGGGGINTNGGSANAGGGSAADLVPANGVTLVSGGSGSGNSGAGGDGFTGGGGGAQGDWGGGGGGYSGGGAGGDGGVAGGGGSYLNTGIGTYVSGSITAGIDGGGGAAAGNGDDGSVLLEFTPTGSGGCTQDTDNDGIIDSYDPDSDGDGIADIIEAGGIDTDGNGIVDGEFEDFNGDGWSDVFDDQDGSGGTPLTDVDTDGDGFEDRIDLDSDADGILDIVESQLTGILISPSGSDSDADGIDDNFDTNEGNMLTSPVNTDGTDNPDYTDTDSDNDGDSDAIEGWDIDNDGLADTSPIGTDSDNDGLDDNFDNEVGPNSTINVTDGGKTSNSYPDLDRSSTPERDWREDKDNDNDGIPDIEDIDDDNDGVLDVNECDASVIFEGGFEGIPTLNTNANNLGVSILPWIATDPTNVINVDGPGGGTYGIGGPEFDARGGAGNYYDINGSGSIYQTFTLSSTETVFYEGYFSARDNLTGNGDITIRSGTGTGGAIQSTTGNISTNDNVNWTYVSNVVTLPAGTYSFVVTLDNPINFDEAGIIIICDSDNDGTPNQYDLDSDGDGIADIIEAGGVDNNRDGIVDDETDTDNDGWADTFDSNDGGTALLDPDADSDGFPNRVDIDADDDGIIDIIESQVSGTLIIPSGSDADGDGIDDNFDPDLAGSLTIPTNTDGTDNPDYTDTNSDNDGHSDLIEAWDTDNDGLADTSPLGADSDNDGLDDNFDNVVGPNNTTNVTNNNQSSGSFPNLDNGNTSERDWREIQDVDGDGIADEFDIDDDNDGILDEDEGLSGNDPSGDEDGDGILNYLDLSDGGNGGDGSTSSYVDDDGNGIPDVFDSDGDGVPNHFDLDADDDGIADIVEAGGVDSDGDGRVDDFTDVDNDGWSNVFDNGNGEGGVALPITNTDGDIVEDYLDLDSDSDGILDNLESQTTIGYRSPENADIDGDGWDDEYDGDVTNGTNGTPIVFSNNDGMGNPDHLDGDSDGDGYLDWIEGFDDDEGGDALNDFILRADAFELSLGNPLYYLTILDADFDGIPNFLEDDNVNGIPNFADPASAYYHDTDNDGLIDLVDPDNGGSFSSLPDQDDDGEYDFRDSDNDSGGLPVELVEFTAKKNGVVVDLDWVTLTEINNDYFEVEKLNQEKEYVPISRVQGAGNSNVKLEYRIIDENPHIGYNYYRLKQVDFDGAVTYSVEKAVLFSKLSFDLNIYPNPSNGLFVYAELNGNVNGRVDWIIFDERGREVYSSFSLIENTRKFNLLNGKILIPGIYFVKIVNGENIILEKIIVR